MAEEQEGAKACFNGGKMSHIFSFNDKFHYDPVFSCPEAKEALLEGMLYYKIDGANGMVQILQDDGSDSSSPKFKIYQRLDTKGKEPDPSLIPLPPGKNPSETKGHTYYYDEITEDVGGKKLAKRNLAMLELVGRHLDKFEGRGEWTSVEWVGEKFNKTPNVPYPVALAIHEDQRVDDKEIQLERSYDGLRKYLLEDCMNQPIEGFVVEHKDVFWKVRADCFPVPLGGKAPFIANKAKSRPPVFYS